MLKLQIGQEFKNGVLLCRVRKVLSADRDTNSSIDKKHRTL
jgi:hypothetical protein